MLSPHCRSTYLMPDGPTRDPQQEQRIRKGSTEAPTSSLTRAQQQTESPQPEQRRWVNANSQATPGDHAQGQVRVSERTATEQQSRLRVARQHLVSHRSQYHWCTSRKSRVDKCRQLRISLWEKLKILLLWPTFVWISDAPTSELSSSNCGHSSASHHRMSKRTKQ